MNFTCPNCGEHRLEEIMIGVTVASTILDVEDGSVDYGEQSNEDGEVQNYQCMDCGAVLTNDMLPITDPEELWQWLEDQVPKRQTLRIRT